MGGGVLEYPLIFIFLSLFLSLVYFILSTINFYYKTFSINEVKNELTAKLKKAKYFNL